MADKLTTKAKLIIEKFWAANKERFPYLEKAKDPVGMLMWALPFGDTEELFVVATNLDAAAKELEEQEEA